MQNIIKSIRLKIKTLYNRYDTKDIHLISAIFSILSTLVMTYLTVLMSIANNRMAEANDRMAESNDKMSISEDQSFVLARYQHTFALCQRFDETYGNIKNIDRYEYKIWEENNPEYEINVGERKYQDYLQVKNRWIISDSTRMDEITQERIHHLMGNRFFQQILQYFEETKILHKKQLLDVDAFENDFVGVLYRLQNTQYPTIDQYIQHVRSLSKRVNKNNIWDGYYYCIQNIMTQNYNLPESGTIIKVFVQPRQKVKAGDVLVSYKPADADQEEVVTSKHNGEIVDVYISSGTECGMNTILLRISQKDYMIKD